MDSRVSSVLYLSYKISTLSSCIMYFIHFLIHRQGTCNIFPTMSGKFRIYSFFLKNVCAFCIITLLKQSCTSERSQSNERRVKKKSRKQPLYAVLFVLCKTKRLFLLWNSTLLFWLLWRCTDSHRVFRNVCGLGLIISTLKSFHCFFFH